MNLEDLLVNYLQTTTRINTKLQILAFKLSFISHPQKIFNKLFSQPCRPFYLFKILILLHHCYLSTSLTAQLVAQIIQKINTKPVKDVLQNMLDERVNNPYKMFLQKRIQEYDQIGLSKQELLYRQMNLLSRGSSFGEFLYTFGRYYQNKYQFAIDFNILIGKDLSQLYVGVAKKIKKLKFDRSHLIQLQNIHEKLFVIYYNCYYFRYLNKFVPKWLNIDSTMKKNNKSKISTNNKSFVSTNCSDSSNLDLFERVPQSMSQSALIESSFNGRQMSELQISQIGLLKSMERVIEEMAI